MQLPRLYSETKLPERVPMQEPRVPETIPVEALPASLPEPNPSLLAQSGVSLFHTLGTVGEHVTNLGEKGMAVLARATAKKQAMDDSTAAMDGFIDYARQADEYDTQLRASGGDIEQYRPKLTEYLLQARKQAIAGLSTPEARAKLLEKILPYELEKLKSSSSYYLAQYKAKNEASLNRAISFYTQQAATASTQEAFLQAHNEGVNQIKQYMAYLDPKEVESAMTKFSQTVWGERARVDQQNDPEGFMTRAPTYKGHADPMYVDDLHDKARKLVVELKNQQWTDSQRREQKVTEGYAADARDWYARTVQERMPSADQSKRTQSDADVLATARRFYDLKAISREEYDVAVGLVTTPEKAGGVSDPHELNDLRQRLYQDRLSKRDIWGSRLAIEDKTKLVSALEERQKANDISHEPGYARGREQIALIMGDPSTSVNPFASVVPFYPKGQDIRTHLKLLAGAYEEYDRGVRSGMHKGDFITFGRTIAEKYAKELPAPGNYNRSGASNAVPGAEKAPRGAGAPTR